MRPDWAGPGSRAVAAIEAEFIGRQINGNSQGHLVGSRAAPEDAQAEMALVPDTYEDLGGAQQVPVLAPEQAGGQAEGVPDSSPCMENIENSSLHSNCGLQTAESPPKPGSQPMHLSESPPKPRSQPMHHSERPPKPSSQHAKQHPDSAPAAGSPVTHPSPQDTPYGSPAGGAPCQAALDQDPAGPPAAEAGVQTTPKTNSLRMQPRQRRYSWTWRRSPNWHTPLLKLLHQGVKIGSTQQRL